MQLDRDSKVLNSSRTAGLSGRPSAIEIKHLHLPVLSSVAIEPLRLLTNLAALISTEIEQLIPPGLVRVRVKGSVRVKP